MEQAVASPKGKVKTKTVVAIGAGVILLGGGIWALVYFSNKGERAGSGDGSDGAGSGGSGGTGTGGSSTNPCASRAGSTECKKQKCNAILATAGRGELTPARIIEINDCKRLLGIPIVSTGGRPDAVKAGEGRGFDGKVIYMRSDAPSPIYPAKAFDEEWVLKPVK